MKKGWAKLSFVATLMLAAGATVTAQDGKAKGLPAVVLSTTDYESLEQAVNAAGTARSRIVVSRTHNLRASLMIPANVILQLKDSGRVFVPTGSTLTLLAPPDAPPSPWLLNALPGQGRVLLAGRTEAYPDWWMENAEPGLTDMSGAIQAAVDSGASCVRFLKTTYRNTRVTEITRSDIELVGEAGTVIHTVRESPMNASTVDARTPSPHVKLSFAFEISGDVEQKNVVIRKIGFTGRGFWGGIYSSLLYPHDGWGIGGYPNVDLKAYTTTRKGCLLTALSFDSPYYEAIALTCVSAALEDISISGGQNMRNHGNIVVRYTNGVSLAQVTLDGCRYKNINTSYVDGLTMSDITIRDAHGGVDGVGVYIGHFARNASLSNYRFSSEQPFEEFIKISYFASDVRVSDCKLSGTGYIMIQAGQRVTLHDVEVITSGSRALQLLDYSGPPSPALRPVGTRIIGCRFTSTASGASPRKIVDLSHGIQTEFIDNTVFGNIYANPAQGLSLVRNNIAFIPDTESGVPAAVYLQDFRGDSAVVIRNNCIETDGGLYALYLNGANGPANVEIVNNRFNYGATKGFGIVANYISSGRFRYADNDASGQDIQSVLFVRYDDSAYVTVE